MATLFREIPDCQSCGACCQHHASVFIAGDDENLAFLQERNLLVEVEDGFVMRETEKKVCVALEGSIGKTVACSIYENRPQACRSYVPGAGQCEIARLFTFGPEKYVEIC